MVFSRFSRYVTRKKRELFLCLTVFLFLAIPFLWGNFFGPAISFKDAYFFGAIMGLLGVGVGYAFFIHESF